MMKAYLLFAIFFPLLFSPLFFYLKSKFPRYLGFIALFVCLASLISIILGGKVSGWNEPQMITIPWVPSLGINLTFITDGLSLFFGILVTGMGILVTWYAQYYMDPKDPHLGRFYACLMFFMGAMLGTVFSTNLMVLFFFWELTGVASFLLIGYWHPEPGAWKGARMALLVTGLTGLALLAGIIMLDILTGTFEWHLMATKGVTFQAHAEWTYPIIICFLIGIFGKSAQFPFYFWLPNAMVAPTPVSAYLHAATMVNLGVFLTARMYPLFASHELWFYMLTTFSFITLLIGAILSLLSNDLKAILAYATVSQLGFFLGFYGIGGEEGIEYDYVHILNHALYKGSLFMLVGIVDHATGIRDVRKLGGLWKKLPLTSFIFLIAAAAMAGIPGTTGFLSKELILMDIIALGRSNHSGWLILGVLIVASLFKVSIAIRIFFHLFVRDVQRGGKIDLIHPPSLAIQFPPLILSSMAFILGILPTQLGHLTSYFYVSGLHKLDPRIMQLWHGWTIELLVSLSILLGGALFFYAAEKTEWRFTSIIGQLNFGDLFDKFINKFPKMCKIIVKPFEPLTYQQQSVILFSFFGILLGGFLIYYSPPAAISPNFALISPVRILTIFLIGLFTILIPFFNNLISRLLALSGCGFFIAIYFALYSAPDLVLTQILVEVATSLIILLLFRHLGNSIINIEPPFSKLHKFTIPIAIACGMTAVLIVALYHSSNKPMIDFFVANSIPYAHGSNIVNTILIDFRSLDTLGETTVILTAMLGVIGLLSNKKEIFFKKINPCVPTNSPILRSIMPLIFILLNLFSIYLLLRGHNYPGGGFVAGLTNGISIIILGFSIQVFNRPLLFMRLGFFGIGIILLAGCLPLFLDAPFLTHYVDFSSLPKVAYISSLTPLIFDTGVYLVVLAMTAKVYFLFREAHFIGIKWS